MTKEQVIHDLAINLALFELQQYRIEHPDSQGYSEEIKYYIKSYFSAYKRIAEEYEDNN